MKQNEKSYQLVKTMSELGGGDVDIEYVKKRIKEMRLAYYKINSLEGIFPDTENTDLECFKRKINDINIELNRLKSDINIANEKIKNLTKGSG